MTFVYWDSNTLLVFEFTLFLGLPPTSVAGVYSGSPLLGKKR